MKLRLVEELTKFNNTVVPHRFQGSYHYENGIIWKGEITMLAENCSNVEKNPLSPHGFPGTIFLT